MADKITLGIGDALVIIDVQNDFLPGGALAVKGGDKVIEPFNRYIELFTNKHLPIVATRDWHPADHASFQSEGGPWPPHCVQETKGAEFAEALKLPPDAPIVSKGVSPEDEDYSNFNETNLEEILRTRGIKRVFIGGLATDYCVRSTVLDALDGRFTVFVLADAVRAVNVKPDDGKNALDEMEKRGACIITLEDIE